MLKDVTPEMRANHSESELLDMIMLEEELDKRYWGMNRITIDHVTDRVQHLKSKFPNNSDDITQALYCKDFKEV